jgi:hypothetical protein
LDFKTVVKPFYQANSNMDITGKLWNFCNKLRHDGVDSSDYIEQLTYLLFLKMAEEKEIPVPNGYDWQSLLVKENGTLVPHLEKVLNQLKNETGILGQIFAEPIVRKKRRWSVFYPPSFDPSYRKCNKVQSF